LEALPPAPERPNKKEDSLSPKCQKMLKVKMILPALQEAESPYWRPIKYSLFPPLGLASPLATTICSLNPYRNGRTSGFSSASFVVINTLFKKNPRNPLCFCQKKSIIAAR